MLPYSVVQLSILRHGYFLHDWGVTAFGSQGTKKDV